MRTIAEIKAEIAGCKARLESESLSDFQRYNLEDCVKTLERQLREAVTEGISISRIEKLCQAEREGRCVVLPCKVGDTVCIAIDRYDTHSQMYGIQPPTVAIVEMTVWSIEIRDGSIWLSDGDRYSGELGKTVHLTREAAEAALKEVTDE